MGGKSKYFDPRTVKVPGQHENIWSRLLPGICFIIILFIVLLAFVTFWPVFRKNQELNSRKEAMTKQIEEAKSLNLKLQLENNSLQTDPVYVERKARDVLNVGKAGEVIFRFPESNYNNQITTTSTNAPKQ